MIATLALGHQDTVDHRALEAVENRRSEQKEEAVRRLVPWVAALVLCLSGSALASAPSSAVTTSNSPSDWSLMSGSGQVITRSGESVPSLS